MGLFQNMASATRGFQSNKLNEGEYVVRVDRCDHIIGDQAGDGYKITVTVLAVGRGSHAEGEVATAIYWKGTGKAKEDQWLSNIKGFIGNLMGVPDSAIDEAATVQTLAEVYDPVKQTTVPGKNVLGGTVCRVTAIERVSKSNGKPYCVYTWNLAMTPAEITSTLGEARIARFFPNGLS